MKLNIENSNQSNELVAISETMFLEKTIVVYGTVEEPLFLAKDVAEWIEYSESNVSKMVSLVDDDEKVRKIVTTPGGLQQMWFLTEHGLYEVLMQSRKPQAKVFKKRVKEILTDVRKNGIYATEQVVDRILDNPDYGIELLKRYKEEKEKAKQLAAYIEKTKPATKLGLGVIGVENAMLIGTFAAILTQNGYKISQNKLFERMRNDGFLCSQKGRLWNKPTQFCLDNGYMTYRESVRTGANGKEYYSITPEITGKGQVYFFNYYTGLLLKSK